MRWRHATHYEGTPLHLDMCSVLDKIAESLVGEITVELDWLSEHVGVLPEDRVRIDPDLWAQMAGFIERREVIRATYQIFDGRVSEYELPPYHLLAYPGNWYLMARNVETERVATFALSRFRRIAAMGQIFTRPAEFNPEMYARQAFGTWAAGSRSRCGCSSSRNWLSTSPRGSGIPARSSRCAGTAGL